jgi:hypothetical protein
VRAERLAALRIGLAAFLLLDIGLTYLPGVFLYFGQDNFGNQAIHGWITRAPRLSWSLLRGFGDPLLSFLAVSGALGLTAWIVVDLATRAINGAGARESDPLRYSVPLWCLASAISVLGLWSRFAQHEGELQFAWMPAVVPVAASLAFLALELARSLRHDQRLDWRAMALLWVACLSSAILLGFGISLSMVERLEAGSDWARLLAPWQEDADFLYAAMICWAVAALFLLLGLATRPAAIVAWVLAISFANINDRIDNAGDSIRNIILFYLMLCPCGAVWSVDRLWRRWRGPEAPVLYVSPWPIRLLFVQMIFIYFCNGVYKVVGESWREGNSLYYVMGDFTLTRISLADCPLPLWVMQAMTWTVLFWELSFPFLVMLHRWTRVVALCFGALFHIGIFMTMELGFFVPYALCLYLPLVPWEWLLDRRKAPEPPEPIVDVDEIAVAPSEAAPS